MLKNAQIQSFVDRLESAFASAGPPPPEPDEQEGEIYWKHVANDGGNHLEPQQHAQIERYVAALNAEERYLDRLSQTTEAQSCAKQIAGRSFGSHAYGRGKRTSRTNKESYRLFVDRNTLADYQNR